MRHLKIASKTFIFGEYLALIGGPALVLAHEPSFNVTAQKAQGCNFHLESAIARWCSKQADLQYMPQSFTHPLKLGGLGLSSAEFLAAYYLNKKAIDPWIMLEDYQNVYSLPPSGYDVLAQWVGGLATIEAQQKIINSQLAWPFADTGFVVIATDKKLATHHHVHQLSLRSKASALISLGHQLIESWSNADAIKFYQLLKKWRLHLLSLGLEDIGTTQIIEKLMRIDGVICAKGCGAMGADMIFAIYKKQSTFLTQLHELPYSVVTHEGGIAHGIKEILC